MKILLGLTLGLMALKTFKEKLYALFQKKKKERDIITDSQFEHWNSNENEFIEEELKLTEEGQNDFYESHSSKTEEDVTIPNIDLSALNLNDEKNNHQDMDNNESKKESLLKKIFPSFFNKKIPKEQNIQQSLIKKTQDNESVPLKDFTFQAFFEFIYEEKNRPKLHYYFLSAFFIVLFYTFGKGIALFLDYKMKDSFETSVKRRISTPLAIGPKHLQTIKSANLFHSDDSDLKMALEKRKQEMEKKQCLQASSPTQLPLSIEWFLVMQDAKKSMLEIKANGKIHTYRANDKIDNYAQIGAITEKQVILKNLNTGECEFLSLEKRSDVLNSLDIVSPKEGAALVNAMAQTAIKNEGNVFKINKGMKEKLLGNISEILTQARAIQIQNPDGSLCFKIVEIVPGSIYSQLNIHNEDMICKIDGQNITNLNQIMNMFGRIKDIDHLRLSVERGGQSQDLEYSFE